MGLYESLKFVQGAVAKKDFLPAMAHFAIEKGSVRAYNGVLALCTPIDLDLECKPKAIPMVNAINHCDETVVMSMTPAGKLAIKSGTFRAYIDCVDEKQTPHVWPEGDRMDFNGEAVLKAFKVIEPFIGDDASRQWSNGVLLSGGSAFATNNVTLVEYWLGAQTPRVVNIPRVCIREMLRIGKVPTHAQLTTNSITFHYGDNQWIRSQLYSVEWPDLSRILNTECNAQPIDERLFDGLDKIKPFADKMGRVFIKDGTLSTATVDGEGAAFHVDQLRCEGVYAIEMLKLLKGIATHADFDTYPRPCLWFGDCVRGAIIGMRQ